MGNIVNLKLESDGRYSIKDEAGKDLGYVSVEENVGVVSDKNGKEIYLIEIT